MWSVLKGVASSGPSRHSTCAPARGRSRIIRACASAMLLLAVSPWRQSTLKLFSVRFSSVGRGRKGLAGGSLAAAAPPAGPSPSPPSSGARPSTSASASSALRRSACTFCCSLRKGSESTSGCAAPDGRRLGTIVVPATPCTAASPVADGCCSSAVSCASISMTSSAMSRLSAPDSLRASMNSHGKMSSREDRWSNRCASSAL